MTVQIAVLVPCYKEHIAIPAVVQSFRAALPDAKVYVEGMALVVRQPTLRRNGAPTPIEKPLIKRLLRFARD